MQVKLAKYAGFCFGVDRAVRMAEEAASLQPLYSLGSIIHNESVMEKLQNRGLVRIDNLEEIREERPVIIRSHGEGPPVYSVLEEKGLKVIDTTCPYVLKVHRLVREHAEEGREVFLLGNPEHPEVKGSLAWGNEQTSVLKDLEEVRAVSISDEPTVLLAQTTLTEAFWDDAVQLLKEKRENLQAINTICSATRERQEAAAQLAKEVDLMIVLGSKESSNTLKLVEICRKFNKNVQHFENSGEINRKDIVRYGIIGITAGASTPSWLIQDVVEVLNNYGKEQHFSMENLSMKDMLEQQDFSAPKKNEILKGKVVMVREDAVIVNIGYKADGILPASEISNPDEIPLNELYEQDQEIDVLVLKRDNGEGDVLLSSKRLRSRQDWENLEEKFKAGEMISVKVTDVVKGGLSAYYNDIRAFIPASHVDIGFVRDLSQFVGETFEVAFLDFDRRKNQIVLSRKDYLEKDKAEELAVFWENIEKNQVIKGVVRRFTPYGAFVDLGPTDGLVHVSEIQWGKVAKPTDVLKANDELEFKVIDFNPEENKISLSLKQMKPDPWEVIDDHYQVGERYDGKIVSLTDFGAFLELEPGLEGLIHVSQISEDRVEVPADILSIGEEVVVKILDIDKEERRIKLSMKE